MVPPSDNCRTFIDGMNYIGKTMNSQGLANKFPERKSMIVKLPVKNERKIQKKFHEEG